MTIIATALHDLITEPFGIFALGFLCASVLSVLINNYKYKRALKRAGQRAKLAMAQSGSLTNDRQYESANSRLDILTVPEKPERGWCEFAQAKPATEPIRSEFRQAKSKPNLRAVGTRVNNTQRQCEFRR